MKPACIASVNAAAGRQLTKSELDRIDGALNATARRLARADRERWRGLSADERTVEAGIQAVKDLQGEARLKQYRSTLQVLRTADTETRIGQQKEIFGGKIGRSKALARDMQNVSNDIAGIKDEAVSALHDLIEGAKSTEGASPLRRLSMFLFDAENPAMTRELALEIFANADGSTKNALAKKGAEAWLKVIEPLRQRFNAAGGDVGKLLYGYLPTLHDATRVLKAGQDAWAEKVLPLLDRRQYLDEAGGQLGDAEVTSFLRAAWETISSEGQNKTEPGEFKGTGSRANRGSESRQIHFKDGEGYLAYQAEFGRGSMYDAMVGHIATMSRDIGLVEKYGPNPETQMKLQFDLAKRADGGMKYVAGNTVEGYWRVLSGAAGVPQNALLARLGSNARAVQSFGKLGSAFISSFADLPTYFITTGFNRLSYWDSIANIGRTLTSKETRDWAAMHGVIGESMLGDMNRFSGDYLSNGTMQRLAQSTMKLSFLNKWTDTLRNAFQLTMMQGMARLSKTDWGDLAAYDRFRMESHGVTEADWAVIRQAKLTERNGLEFLTPEAIRSTGHDAAPQVVSKVLGLIKDEGEYAVLNPDLATKTIQNWGGTQSGTLKGELSRSVMQFKSFPIAMITRHWQRTLETPSLEGRPIAANPLAYGTMLAVSLTALGAISLQAKTIVSGKDPIDMRGEHAAKFWLQAFVQGGGASVVGDMLLKDTTDGGTGFASATAKTAIGPALGNLTDMLAALKDNVDRKLKGQHTHMGADSVRVARGNLPFVNLWYTKAAVDHMGMQQLQENLSPGYLSKQRAKAAKDWGSTYWWAPTAQSGTGPSRAPDLGKAVGR